MDEHRKHIARHVLTIGAFAAAVGAAPVLAASPPDIEKTYEMKDGSKLLVYRDGKMAMQNTAGHPIYMKDGVEMQTRDGTRLMMKGNELWRLDAARAKDMTR